MKISIGKSFNKPDSSSFCFVDVITRLGEGQPHITETLPRLGQTLLQVRICDFLENCLTRFGEVTLTLRDLGSISSTFYEQLLHALIPKA